VTVTVRAAFFSQPNCRACRRSEQVLKEVRASYPQLEITRFDARDDPALFQYLCDRALVPATRYLVAPALFVGWEYLTGDDLRAQQIEEAISPYFLYGAREPWLNWEASVAEIEESMVRRFRSFGTLAVAGAGFLDGLSPFALATMGLMISCLSRRRLYASALLVTGGAFTLGVLLTNLAVGLGFLKVLASSPLLSAISRWAYGVTALLSLALVCGCAVARVKMREVRIKDVSLTLADRLCGWTNALTREAPRPSYAVLIALALGCGVAVVERAYSGQVYLPTIIYVLGVPTLRTQASLALLLYSVMFILPLIGVFLLVYFGTTSQQLIAWMTKHTASIKLGKAALFLLLAAWLGYSIIAL
jgi:hypothetical protein